MRPLTACIAATCVFALATSAKADTNEFCTNVGELARVIMTKRQADFPMSTLMQSIDGVDEATRPLARLLIIMAYQKPDFSVEENQQEAVAEFRNQAELSCYQNKR